MFIRNDPWVVSVESTPYEYYIMLMSDLHIGSAHVDYKRIKRDLECAREHNARILINGDVFDMILPSDRKRFDIRALHPNVLRTNDGDHAIDIVGRAIEWAAELLGPYASLIDIIGCGNHETSIEKHHSFDPISALIDRLRGTNNKIEHGGIEGYYVRQVKDSNNRVWPIRIRYHHGAGGSAPVTRGLIDQNRAMTWITDADVVWIGHKHNRLVDSTTMRERLIANKRVVYEPVYWIQTGGYFDRSSVVQGSIGTGGRRAMYASDRMLPPQNAGGVLLRIRCSASGGLQRQEIKAII